MAIPTPSVHFNFNESSGDTTDAVNSLVGVNTSVTYGAGKLGNAAYFGGSAYFTVADNAILEPTNAISIGGWVYISSTSSYQMMCAKGENAGDTRSYEMRAFASTTQIEVQMRAGGGGYILARTTTAIGTGTWAHVIFTRSGTTNRFYVNGTLETLATNFTNAGNIDYNTDALWIGQRNGGLRFNGRLDAYGIWPVELTSSEVLEHYNSTAGIEYPFTAPATSSGFMAFF